MDASDKDGLSRGYGAVLWPPDDRADPAGTAIVLYSERARRALLTYAELAEQVARVAALRRGTPEAVSGHFRGHPRGS
jgi:acyl-coenzyme A synthetase/AMP-(fatty) acid ligase